MTSIRGCAWSGAGDQFELALAIGVQPRRGLPLGERPANAAVAQLRKLGVVSGRCSDEIVLVPTPGSRQSPGSPVPRGRRRADYARQEPGQRTPARTTPELVVGRDEAKLSLRFHVIAGSRQQRHLSMNRTDLTVASGPDTNRQEQAWESEGGALVSGTDPRGGGDPTPRSVPVQDVNAGMRPWWRSADDRDDYRPAAGGLRVHRVRCVRHALAPVLPADGC